MNDKTKATLSSPWIFFAATYAWTWLIWGAAILLGADMESETGILYFLPGIMGPMVMGIAFTYLTRGEAGRRDYWRRIVSFRRIPVRWALVIVFFVPILNVLAALLDFLTGGGGATWGEAARNVLTDPLSIIPSIIFSSLIPFIEELGWRGYSLDRLQERHNALLSSLILGVVWSLWHLPAFFVQGSYQAGLGVGTLAFWLFIVGVVPLNLPFTWLYNNTNRSTLAVILLHAMVNFTGELIALTERADTIAIGLWFAAAAGITAIWGARTLTRDEKLPAVP